MIALVSLYGQFNICVVVIYGTKVAGEHTVGVKINGAALVLTAIELV